MKHRPLSDDQSRQLHQLLKEFDSEQLDWLSGYIAGWRAALAEGPAEQRAAPETGPALTILYGSQTGNAEKLAEQLKEKAAGQSYRVRLVDLLDYKPKQLKNEQFLALLSSTHGEGDPPDSAMDFHEFLHSRKAPRLDHLHYSVLALGDSSYTHFCQTGRDFDSRLQALGASPLVARVDCDVDYDEPAAGWMDRLLEALAHESGASRPAAPTAGAGKPAAGATATRYGRSHPFPAPVLTNQPLNGRGSDKVTRHIELSLENAGLTYEPGDALGVYPQNDPALVRALLDALELPENETVRLADAAVSLEEALRHYREISRVRPTLLEKWSGFCAEPSLQRLNRETESARQWVDGRDLLDLARAYPPVGMDPQKLVDALPRLAPRLYSIASSQQAVEDEVHLTVAAVAFTSHGRQRQGVASGWLAGRLDEEASVPVYIEPNRHFRLPEDDDTPIIMIGPGTGIAPFRAFLQEREERDARGPNWLFFGDQHFRTDFLYQTEWLAWRRQGLLTRLDLAFSRDQAEKRYVQHRLRERAADIWRWLEDGACLYVCGDAQRMAPDVHEALTAIISEQGGLSKERAREYLRQLTRDKRYQRDVY